ncbi:DUF2474 domain-containing protein [Bordetella petrii]|jgi:hypothetical protein|nr:DUF2474 domain-containing protein [Bordetella petrii]
MKRPARLWIRRLAWLAFLWGSGVAVVFALAQLIKTVMRNSGLG